MNNTELSSDSFLGRIPTVQYIKINKMHTNIDLKKISKTFIRYFVENFIHAVDCHWLTYFQQWTN